ncbi:2OG-Fe(II) oxygenase [Novosphingobium sp. PASSN1]|uniref:prolyl hydroxylase family protein n=1 Tax=Novosphingobium sp. PASSN1 TaxID=2015561 RepID=UPI000BDAAFDD|nr:2OG-Fe(II) oxygenase [Novosphingobium sp. PASSN1]OYU35622.1 MAG: 2OG-Fe(II) oxygenase [Novosphingobium sp. PASSN1]
MMKFRRTSTDQDAPLLAKVGERVRARLEADPSAYRLPVDGIELYGVADFFSAEECTRLIAMVDAVARPSPTYHGNADSGRTSYTGDVDSSDPFIRMIERRIDDFLGIDPDFGEVVQGQRYEPGQQFRAHFDYFDTSAAYWPTEVKRGGQRSWTAMGYLSAVEAGGATEFPKVPISVPPQKGALLVWNNMGPGGKPNPLTLHAGMPVERGVKYIVTKWYRARPWF